MLLGEGRNPAWIDLSYLKTCISLEEINPIIRQRISNTYITVFIISNIW